MTQRHLPSRPFRPAFTLIELLVVVALVGILMGLAAPALTSVMRGNDMARAQQIVESSIEFARQTAIVRNRRVELRFYKFNDPLHPSGAEVFRGVQPFLIEENNDARPLGKFLPLPAPIIISSSPVLSPALNSNDKTFSSASPADPKVAIPGRGTSYSAKVIVFRPDGSTNLEQKKDFLTMHPARNPTEASLTAIGTDQMPDYCVIQIDPLSGAAMAYRP